MKRLSTLVFLLSACAHVTVQPQPSKRMVRRCTPVLEEILHVQDIREELNAAASESIELYKAGLISKEKFKVSSADWLRHENILRSYVTRLYNKAYRKKCL